MWSDYLSLKEYLIRKRYPVLIKKYSKNIFLFYPILFIPFRRFPVIVRLNEKLNIFLLKTFIFFLKLNKGIKDKILWIFDPQTEPITKYFDHTWKTLYDCVDFFTSNAKTPGERQTVLYENKLATNSDFVFANSIVLYDHLKDMRPDTVLVSQGFRIDSFMKSKPNKNVPILKKKDRPLIGFVGGINQRIDYPLLYGLVKKHPEWDFALWGPILEEYRFKKSQVALYKKLLECNNLTTGQSDKSEIPNIVSQFDIGMIPYDITDNFNKYCYPMKIFEFFYSGLPVVSTEIVELKRFPDLVRIGKNVQEWEAIIFDLLSAPWSKKNKYKEMRFAVENSWENKVNSILKFISVSKKSKSLV